MPRPSAPMPRQLFFSTPEQRLALARERFFERGERPSGLVNDAVLQSWSRCLALGRRPHEEPNAESVSRTRLHSALRLSRQLREASTGGLQQLEAAIAGTPCRVILTNPEGVVVYISPRGAQPHETTMLRLGGVGTDLSEANMGTSAPGIVAKTGHGCSVQGGEHFSEAVGRVHCAAAPIRDVHGQLAGVLDLTVEGHGFGFDAFALVGSYASTIENHLLQLQSDDLLVLAFQADPSLLGTPLEALAGVCSDGRLRWVNTTAIRLARASAGQPVADALGHELGTLLGLLRQSRPQPLRLSSGLTVWMQARLRSGDGAGPLLPAPVPQAALVTEPPALTAEAPATLDMQRAHQIAHTLQACGGNVARAARQLGVSRGLIYRNMKPAPAPCVPNGNTSGPG
ncbi:helix-turn-helix domain-containing protein [Xylophilus sp. GW821-FHT01B05]